MFVIVFKSCFSKVANLHRSCQSGCSLKYPLCGIPHVFKKNGKRVGSHHGNYKDD